MQAAKTTQVVAKTRSCRNIGKKVWNAKYAFQYEPKSSIFCETDGLRVVSKPQNTSEQIEYTKPGAS